MGQQIYYCFERLTGNYAGSGVTDIQNDTHECTTVAVCEYDSENGETAVWDGEKWEAVKLPDESWLKADIQAWLTDKGVTFTLSMTKAQLLELV